MKKLYRNPDKGYVGGVCHGLGYYFNLDPLIVRSIWVALSLMMPVGPVVAYIAMWALTPKYKQPRRNNR